MAKTVKKVSKTLSFLMNTLMFGLFVVLASSIPNVFKKNNVARADVPSYGQGIYYSESGYYGQGSYYSQSGYGGGGSGGWDGLDGDGDDGGCDDDGGGGDDGGGDDGGGGDGGGGDCGPG